MDDEAKHVEFILAALRGGSLRCKVMHADIELITLALNRELIGANTAVAWIKDSGLSWLIGAIPDAVGKIAKSNPTEDDDAGAANASG